MPSRRRSLRLVFVILALLAYIGGRLLPPLALGWTGTALALAALLTAAFLVPRSIRRSDAAAWVGLIAMGFFSTLFVTTLARDVLLLAVHVLAGDSPYRALLEPSALGALALTVVVTAAGFVIARRPRVVKVDIPISGLPAPLHGFTITQISDVHVGPTIRRGFVERLVRRVNGLKADLIAVTGDLVDGSVLQLASHTAPLSGLSAPHGAFFVTGNHEYYSGESDWTREIRRLGLTVLKNQHVVLEHRGASLVVAGVDDPAARHFEPTRHDAARHTDPAAAALDGAPPDAGARILLAHQPSYAETASRAGFDVQISGHTHGGQFWPWNLFVGFFQPFTAGLYRVKNLWVYVNRGTGYWGPPNRFGVPAEITSIRLVPAAAG
jgi:predicted MPP superfamily phosphohydrolase